jgi:hypothetical protein
LHISTSLPPIQEPARQMQSMPEPRIKEKPQYPIEDDNEELPF